jgi:hypothetical protein
VPCHETPARLDHVLNELRRRQFAPLREPGAADPRAPASQFVMEGGYAVAEVGVNVVNVLEGFLN